MYAVHAALGLTVSDVMLQGSQVVIVEGISDQYYLSTIKNALIREGRIKPNKEIVFAPAGGVKGVPGITGLVSAKNDDLPFVILDSDSSGEGFRDKLFSGLYKECREKVLEIKSFTGLSKARLKTLCLSPSLKRELKNCWVFKTRTMSLSSPWAVIYDNNFYYLLAYDGKKMRVYRIDHMEGVEIEEAEAEGLEEFKKINLSNYPYQDAETETR